VSKPPPPAAHPVKLAGGFIAGLAAGWHALRQVTSWLLTGIGAALPFAVFAIGAAFAALWGWRRLARHRAGQEPQAEHPAG
jgi:membrane protein implicated in regulation of membrane protease activity